MLKEKIYYLSTIVVTNATPNVDEMGDKLYDKAIQFGKWGAIFALVFIAFKLFLNRKDSAGTHLKSVVMGVFILVLAPTIIAILFWIAQGLKI